MGRAIAHGRTAVVAFSDPTAMALLSAEQQAEVERIRQGPRPKAWRARFRYEHLTRESQMMVARTVAIDADLRSAAVPQVVILRKLLARYGFSTRWDRDLPAIGSELSAEIGRATRLMRHLRIVTADRKHMASSG
jgi:hypothetical protein